MGAKRQTPNEIKNNIEYSVIKSKYCIFSLFLPKIKKNSSQIKNKKYHEICLRLNKPSKYIEIEQYVLKCIEISWNEEFLLNGIILKRLAFKYAE